MKEIKDMEDFEDLVRMSHNQPVFLFKLSPICSISMFVQRIIEKFVQSSDSEFKSYKIDVVGNRAVSRSIAEKTGVQHQSPQALLFRNGECVWNESHQYITEESLNSSVQSNT